MILPRSDYSLGKKNEKENLGLNTQERFLSMCHIYLGHFAIGITTDDLGVIAPIIVFPWMAILPTLFGCIETLPSSNEEC